MSIICITRELAAMGEETARALAEKSGYRYVEKVNIESRLAEYDIGPQEMEKYDEKRPGLWASLSESRERYLHFLKLVLFEEACQGDCIILGRGGGSILRGVPNVLSVRLIAPMDVRVARIKSVYSCDDKSALQIIKRNDNDREGFHRVFFDVDWRDPPRYDLVLNTGKISPAKAASVIDKLRARIITEAEEDLAKKMLRDMTLQAKIMGEILYVRKTPVHTVQVSVENGKAVLYGVVSSHEHRAAALAAARSAAGDTEVVDDLRVVPSAR